MTLLLHIPPCIQTPPHSHHPPPRDKPLRIRIQGPLVTIQKLLPDTPWHPTGAFPQPGGIQLANFTHKYLYGGEELSAAAVRDEYLAWEILIKEGRREPQE
jgi:hypothetical protein